MLHKRIIQPEHLPTEPAAVAQQRPVATPRAQGLPQAQSLVALSTPAPVSAKNILGTSLSLPVNKMRKQGRKQAVNLHTAEVVRSLSLALGARGAEASGGGPGTPDGSGTHVPLKQCLPSTQNRLQMRMCGRALPCAAVPANRC